MRAIQADYAINGVFNVAYDNFTVGHVADTVKDEVEELTGQKVRVQVNHREDYRNYKVACDKAKTLLGFSPKYSVNHMIRALHKHQAVFSDFANDSFYNIRVFKRHAETDPT